MNSTDTGLIFPDSDFYAFLREYNLDASQLTKLGFGHNCNVIFDSQLLRSNPIQSLKSIEFDKICWLNSVHYGYCLEVPDEWKQRVQLINNRFCIPSRLDSVDEFPILYEELENHIELLNNSLNRALHLYTETEKANRQLQIEFNKNEQDKKMCDSTLNRTINIFRLRQRQLLKCTDQLERTQKLKVDQFKDSLDKVYTHFINSIYN